MDIITILIGALIGLYGIYTLYTRFTSPEKLKKLQPMKEKFGSKVGITIHTIAYSIMPLIVGSSVLTAGVKGISIMQIIAA